ncbi:DUF4442 domain-containing protein [Mangrovimonas aestuarii]|uniref:DUF4442 domain-containing protein n=1 Tax=Mangrovimonas aestuarii TaxID=3018443 RepID=UPI002379EF52|nr:DUF4442 domain-containing protein [Mangrovimonas aestuarii]
MIISPRKLNMFLAFKLPSAFLCGIRVKHIDGKRCEAGVKYRWINQNPFKSMFWAVQGMAAELTTGALVMSKIKKSGAPISMLVASNQAVFVKKAVGRITFTCKEGDLIDAVIDRVKQGGEGESIWLHSVGVNRDGVEVSRFGFEWTLKRRK